MIGLRIGIDLGGTKIETVLMDRQGSILGRRRIATPRDDYLGTCGSIVQIIEDWDARAQARCAVGIGTPGAWEGDAQAMKNCNSTWLNGRALLTDLEERVGSRVRIANDADCLALSEATDGAARGTDPVFGAILGTGVGGGIVVGGRLLRGANGIAGEWGHTPLPYFRDDPFSATAERDAEARLKPRDCYCGRRNCVEIFLSGPGLARTHLDLWSENSTAERVAGARDDRAALTLAVHARMTARALAQIINLLDPAVIVLGGGVSNIETLYSAIPILWQPYVFSARVSTRLVRALHGDASGVRGAAWLWPADYTL